MRKLVILIMVIFSAVSCGKKDDSSSSSIETETKVFSFSEFATAGLSISSYQSTLFILCSDDTPATSQKRQELLQDLINWVNESEGQLEIQDNYISEYTILSLAREAKDSFNTMSLSNTGCPSAQLAYSYF
jgi:hypothetical protein